MKNDRKNHPLQFNKVVLTSIFDKHAHELVDVAGVDKIRNDYYRKLADGQGELNRNWVHLAIAHNLFKHGLLDKVESQEIDIITKNGLAIEITRVADEETIIKSVLEKKIQKQVKKFLRFDFILNGLDWQLINKQFTKDLKQIASHRPFPQTYNNAVYDLRVNQYNQGEKNELLINLHKGGLVNMSTGRDYVLNVHYGNNQFNINQYIINKCSKSACSRSQMLIVDLSGSEIIKNHTDFACSINSHLDKKTIPQNLLAVIFVKFTKRQEGITLSLKSLVRENSHNKDDLLAVCKAIANSISE